MESCHSVLIFMISIPFRKTKKRKGDNLDSAQRSEEKILKTSETALGNINSDINTVAKPVTENSSTEIGMEIVNQSFSANFVDQEVNKSSLFYLVT